MATESTIKCDFCGTSTSDKEKQRAWWNLTRNSVTIDGDFQYDGCPGCVAELKKLKRPNESYHPWMIVRYKSTGGSIDKDSCVYDGIYTFKSHAKAIYDTWCRDYPDWFVQLVEIRERKCPDK